MPPSADAYAPAQAALRTAAPSLLQQAVSVSIVATLAGAAAAGLMHDTPDALADLGLNALGGWLGEVSTRWFPPDQAPDHAALAARIEAGLAQPVVAADVTELLARTDALATVLAGLHGQAEAQARLLQRVLDEVTSRRLTDERLHTATLQTVLIQTGAVIDTVRAGNATLAAQLTDAVARTETLIAAVRQRDAELAAQLTAARAQVLQVQSDLVQGDQHRYENHAPNQGAQGTFHAPVTVTNTAPVTLSISASEHGTASGNRQIVVQPGGVYHESSADPLPAIDPAEAQARLAALPTDRVPKVATLPPGSRMPLGNNPLFTGRDDDLLRLAQALAAQRTSVVTAGIGGVGKTSLAAEFAHRYGHYFAGGVFWLSFAEAGAIPAEIAACGGTAGLRLPSFDTLDFPAQVARVQAEWQYDTPRLLIFDNCEDPALVRAYHPTTGGCRVLITSRNALLLPGRAALTLPLDVFSRAQSITFLQQFRATLTDADAGAIAALLGDLPLALHLAGSYLESDPDITATHYLQALDQPTLLEHISLVASATDDRPTDRAMHVAKAFALSYGRLQATVAVDATAQQLLARAARFAPGEPLARTLLLATLPIDEADDTARAYRTAAYRRLLSLGLLEQEADDTVRMHRLLCAYALPTAPSDGAQDAVEDVLARAAYAVLTAGYPAAMQPLLAHLQHTTERARARADARAATLLSNYASYLNAIGAYAQAEPLYERALDICEQVLGAMHPLTASSLNNLAGLYEAQGAYDQAAPLYERALDICEQVLGADHPNTALSLNNLAALYQSQGAYDRAEPLYARALDINEQVLGAGHPDTATSLNNLAELYKAQGAYDRAAPLYARALDIREQVLGAGHPDTATSLNNLAVLYQSQGAYDRALPLFERALAMREQVLGAMHPDTAQSLNNLAYLYQSQGAYDRAAPLYERALDIREQVLGAMHPDTALSLNNLAGLYEAQGAYDRAAPLYERALDIREQVLGAMHPDTASSLNNLAALYEAQEAYDRALPLYERALAIHEQVLGAMHPLTATSLNNLAVLFYYMERYPEAHDMMVRALAIREQVLGTQHPLTQSSQRNLAAIRQRLAPAQRDPVEALAPVLDAIAALAQGRTDIDRARVEEALDQLQQRGYLLRDPVQRIWQGERDTAALTAGLDETDTRLIAAVLARLQGDEHPTTGDA